MSFLLTLSKETAPLPFWFLLDCCLSPTGFPAPPFLHSEDNSLVLCMGDTWGTQAQDPLFSVLHNAFLNLIEQPYDSFTPFSLLVLLLFTGALDWNAPFLSEGKLVTLRSLMRTQEMFEEGCWTQMITLSGSFFYRIRRT